MLGREFELLAEQIYKELEPLAQVTHNDHIMGLESEISRQIDVSIRYSIDGVDRLTIIQTKDYGDKPADINVVGEFASVIKDVAANKGILICKSGFTRSAKKYAQNLGIDICNLHDAQSRRWSLDIQFPIVWTDFFPTVSLNMKMDIQAGDALQKDPREWMLLRFSKQGEHLGEMPLMDIFVQLWNSDAIPIRFRKVGDQYSIDYANSVDTLKIVVWNENQNKYTWRDIKSIKIEYTVSKKSWLGSFSPDECRGILNYADNVFQPSYLRIGEIPFEKGKGWKEIDDPDQLVITNTGILVTTEHWRLDAYDSEAHIRSVSTDV